MDADYNEEPVHFCSNCLYLGNPSKIDNMDVEFCPYCGSLHFEEAGIEEWEALFEHKYRLGKFINIKKDKGENLWQKILTSINKESQ